MAWWTAADAELQRRYTRRDTVSARVYIGYFESQRQRKEVISFLSSPLHRQASPVSMQLPDGGVLHANAIPSVEGLGTPALFWYEFDGIVETSEYSAKLRMLKNALLRRRTNGAVVMVWAGAAVPGVSAAQVSDRRGSRCSGSQRARYSSSGTCVAPSRACGGRYGRCRSRCQCCRPRGVGDPTAMKTIGPLKIVQCDDEWREAWQAFVGRAETASLYH